jgi:hypothetical protein
MQVKLKVHAHAKPTKLQLTEPSSALSGTLYVQIGDAFFPGEGSGTYVTWSLDAWMQDAMKLLLPDTDVQSIYMDSNAIMCLRRRAGSDDVTVRFYDHDGSLMSEHVVSYKRYLAALRGAAKSLLHEIEEQGLHAGPAADTLRDRITHIERLEVHIKERGLP